VIKQLWLLVRAVDQPPLLDQRLTVGGGRPGQGPKDRLLGQRVRRGWGKIGAW
jgi:hypothetical protein